MYRLFINIDYNKRGQTSRFVAGAQIQTGGNFKKNVFGFCPLFVHLVTFGILL